MKMLITIGSFFPAQKGGPDNSVFNLAKVISSNIEDVQVVCLFDSINEKLKKKILIKENLNSDISNFKVIYFKYYFFRFISPHYIFWLLFNIRKYQIIYINSIFFYISFISLVISSLLKKNIIISPRGELEPQAIKYKFFLKKIYLLMFKKFISLKSTTILVTSKDEIDKSKKFLPNNIKYEIIENFIDTDSEDFKGIVNNHKRNNIIYLGRLHPKKNIEELIKAYSLLSKNIVDNHKLVLIGKGNNKYKLKLVKFINDLNLSNYVIFLGHKEGNEKLSILSHSKLLVLPSHTENFGNVIIEAYSSFLPCICSANTPWKILEKLKIGYCYKGDYIDLYKKMIELLNWNSEKYFQICEKGKQFITENYSIKSKDTQIKKFLRQIDQN